MTNVKKSIAFLLIFAFVMTSINISTKAEGQTITLYFFNYGGDNPDSITYTYGEGEITLPVIDSSTRPGYIFDGWCEEVGPKIEWSNTRFEEDTTLSARWVKSEITLTFDLNHGEGIIPGSIKYSYGEGTINPPDGVGFNRPLYTFDGWSKYPNGSKIENWSKTEFLDDTTLYARWKGVELTMSLELNGGTCDVDHYTYLYPGYDFDPPLITKPGYELKGLSSEKDSYQPIDYKNIDTITSDITAYAYWEPKDIRINFYINGGTGQTPAYQTYKYGIGTLSLPTADEFSRTGFTFDGWSKTYNGPKITSWSNTEVTENSTLYARWTKLININFNTNGGQGTITNFSYYYGNGDNPVILPSGETLTKTNYTFDGWSKYPNGPKIENWSNTEVTENTTLYARWKGVEICLTFDSNGAGLPITTQKYNFDNDSLFLPNIPREGFSLKGWSKDPNATIGTFYWYQNSVSENTTLYAVWALRTYFVYFDIQGAVGETGAVGEAPEDMEYTDLDKLNELVLPDNRDFSKEGYIFDGWCAYDYWNERGQFSPYIYRDTINGKDGWWYKNESGEIEAALGHPETKEINGRWYLGHYNELNEWVSYGYFDENYKWIGTGTWGYGPKITEWNCLQEEVFARWIKPEITLSFDLTGGSGVVSPIAYVYQETSVTLPTGDGISKPGCIFDGWSLTPGGEKIESWSNTQVTENTTLYARWKAIAIKVRVSKNIILDVNTGKAKFSVATENLEFGNLSISVPNTIDFYQGERKITGTISLTEKVITSSNPFTTGNITIDKDMIHSGSWFGSFAIDLEYKQ